MNVNLDEFFDAQKPTITIFGKVYEVDNDYKKVLSVQTIANNLNGDVDTLGKFLSSALVDGKAAADEILSHNIPFPLIEKLVLGVTAVMTGKDMKVLEQAAKEAEGAQFARFPAGKGKRV